MGLRVTAQHRPGGNGSVRGRLHILRVACVRNILELERIVRSWSEGSRSWACKEVVNHRPQFPSKSNFSTFDHPGFSRGDQRNPAFCRADKAFVKKYFIPPVLSLRISSLVHCVSRAVV